jgi:hypothetical protein
MWTALIQSSKSAGFPRKRIWRFWRQCREVLTVVAHLDTALKRFR